MNCDHYLTSTTIQYEACLCVYASMKARLSFACVWHKLWLLGGVLKPTFCWVFHLISAVLGHRLVSLENNEIARSHQFQLQWLTTNDRLKLSLSTQIGNRSLFYINVTTLSMIPIQLCISYQIWSFCFSWKYICGWFKSNGIVRTQIYHVQLLNASGENYIVGILLLYLLSQ